MRKISVSIMCLLLCLVTITGCGKKPTEEMVQTTEAVAQTVPVVTEMVSNETETRHDVVVISTAYGDICYQEQWSEHIVVEQVEEGKLLRVSFLAEFNGLRYALFDLMIGVGEDEAVATITDAAGTVRNVGVNFLELGEFPELSEDDQNQLYAMQEDINYVIENIQ